MEALVKNAEGEKEDVLSSEFIQLLQILPEEIWKLVAGKLSSEDVESLANSSDFFRNLLASQRTTYLFEKVFPLVASSVWKHEGLEGLPVSEVLKLRGVCSHWNAVIDKLIPEQFQHFGKLSSGNERIADAFKSILKPTSFAHPEVNNTTLIPNFLRHFEATHPSYQSKGRDPFIWGNILVNIWAYDEEAGDDYEVYRRYLQDILTVLSKYGRYLHKLSLEMIGFDDTSILRDWFLNLPNLKELKFLHGVGLWEHPSRLNCECPKLEHLETLDTDDLPGPLFNRLIGQTSQISSLIMNCVSDDLDDYDFFTFALPNLRKLKVGRCEVEDVEKFRSSQVQWPLESLTLDYWINGGPLDFNFEVLQDKFGDTLVSLDLQMTECEDEESELWQDCKEWRHLELPNLKKIKLAMYKNPVYLDFLLPMRLNLEEISVQVGYKLPLPQDGIFASGTIVQFMGFEGKMLESNIWAIFKKLKKIEIKVTATWVENRPETRCYSRKEWMENNVYY